MTNILGTLDDNSWDAYHTLEFCVKIGVWLEIWDTLVTPWIGTFVCINWDARLSWDACGQTLGCLPHLGTL